MCGGDKGVTKEKALFSLEVDSLHIVVCRLHLREIFD